MGEDLGLGRENRFDRVQESENDDERQKQKGEELHEKMAMSSHNERQLIYSNHSP